MSALTVLGRKYCVHIGGICKQPKKVVNGFADSYFQQMKKFFVALFTILSLLFIGFVCGGWIAGEFIVTKHDGLAGGAIVAFWGFGGSMVGLILGILAILKLNERSRAIVALSATLMAVCLWGVFHYRYKQKQADKAAEDEALFGSKRPLTAVAIEAESMKPRSAAGKIDEEKSEMGIGMVSVLPVDGKVLLFYSKPEHFELPNGQTATDSLTFKSRQHYVDIATAPPWFVPEYSKLDYGILQLKAIIVNRNWVEVVVNRSSGQTAWVYLQDVEFATWPEFLLQVHSVELLRPEDFLPRIKPMDHAEPISNVDPGGFFYPISIKDDWMEVHPDHELDSQMWIRWRRDGKLLIKYSMLS